LNENTRKERPPRGRLGHLTYPEHEFPRFAEKIQKRGEMKTMKKTHLLTFMLSTAIAAVPVASFAAVPQDHPDQNDHKAAAHQNYRFRSQDKGKLQQHYRTAHTHPANAHRWAWHRGVNLPSGWQGQVEALPQEDIALLAPPPPGYEFGYYNGWAIVYDPNTGVILNAVVVQ
jgi:Ni/Co efflux regulator RcnB